MMLSRPLHHHAPSWPALLALLALAAACSDKRSSPSSTPDQRPPGTHDAGPAVRDASASPADAPPPPAPRVIESFLEGDENEKKALAAIGAVRVWNAVVNRGEYLARRKRSGIIHGRLGPVVGPYRWIIDEREGSGSLSVRLAVPAHVADPASLSEDDRLVVWGAWHVDDEHKWYWKADRLARLPDRPWQIPVEERSAPGHVIVDIPRKPPGTLLMADLTHMGGTILFEVVRAPDNPADGWEISGATEWRAEGRLHLPGEDETYGGQDLRSPEEHWQLERNTPYVVRIKRFLPAKGGTLANMTALDAPRRLVKGAPGASEDDDEATE